MKNKLIMWFFVIGLLCGLVGCGGKTTTPTTATTTTVQLAEDEVQLPDLTGKSRAEINEIFENLGLTIKYSFVNSEPYNQDGSEYDKFVKYQSKYNVGSVVKKGTTIQIYTTPLNLPGTELSENLKLEAEYTASNNFIQDGIGIVTLVEGVDGDTSIFRQQDGQTFTVRYLGIDTPESTYRFDPWGKEAKDYTNQILANAKQIVLQAEGERTDGNERYLAWVWVDGVLLNLRLVELGYSQSKVAAGSIYTSIITQADFAVTLTGRRVSGEKDPNFDYSRDGVEITIENLINNFDECIGVKLIITGTITSMVGPHPYIQDENGYGIYLYTGYNGSAQLEVGANVTIQGLEATYHNGAPQLSNFMKNKLTVNSTGNVVEPVVMNNIADLMLSVGSYVKYNNLTVTKVYEADNKAITLTCRDAAGNTVYVRKDASQSVSVDVSMLQVGVTFNITGPVTVYNDNCQIMVTNTNLIELVK